MKAWGPVALALVVALAMPPQGAAWAQASAATAGPPTREQVQQRVKLIGTLVLQSSGAKQIEAGDDYDAKLPLTKARSLHEQAVALLEAGDLETAQKMLHAAQRTMMEAVALSSAEQTQARKERTDFDNRRASARALLDASRRIVTEKDAGPGNAELIQRIEVTMAEADRLAASGRVGDARRVLDQAYGAARAAVSGLRGGETLVRSLNFASKEEEFHYEIDRNEAHRMLITLLLQDRRGSIDTMVQRALEASSELRKQGDQQAQRREFDAGVKSLEDSTRHLQRAIRAAGVYIPG